MVLNEEKRKQGNKKEKLTESLHLTVKIARRSNDNMTLAGGRWVLPCKRVMGMCCWMGLHFHNWIDYNGVAFSTELLEWGHKFSDFGGK